MEHTDERARPIVVVGTASVHFRYCEIIFAARKTHRRIIRRVANKLVNPIVVDRGGNASPVNRRVVRNDLSRVRRCHEVTLID